MSNVTARYGTLLGFIAFFMYFHTLLMTISMLQVLYLTKLSQIVCLTNTHTYICWHARCNHKLWKFLWFDCVFWKFQCLTRYILHQTFIHFVVFSLWPDYYTHFDMYILESRCYYNFYKVLYRSWVSKHYS